ncbi:OmpA family protein [Pseudosporangium ferrugineum]|uniref:OmpA family protein n=1 Tax=Pseudosporangium ferrugineum TaxID=439699 RepID=UPI0011B21A57|nr:OmpA family protein [Pseudosporangium ferrugineum]
MTALRRSAIRRDTGEPAPAIVLGALLALLCSAAVFATGTPAYAATTTVQVTATPQTSVTGQSVTVCAQIILSQPSNVTASDLVTPTGSVNFGGAGLLANVVLDQTGTACTTSSTLTSGTITALYSGDANQDIDPGSGSTPVTVLPALTTTVVSATPNPSVTGDEVTVCATVTALAPATGTPTGAVTFLTPEGLRMASLTGGQACYNSSTLMTGVISAFYDGGIGYLSSSGTTTATVNPADTTTEVSATPDPSVRNHLVQLCATVTAAAPVVTDILTPAPTGTVTFTGPGGLNDIAVLVGGQACTSSTSLTTGTVTATYGGDTKYNTSTDTTPVTVDKAETVTSASASPATTVTGQGVDVCASVSESFSSAGSTTGLVTFSRAGGTGTANGNGPSPTGTVTFTGPGDLNRTVALSNGQACFISTTLETGTITATYSGDDDFKTSTDTAEVTVNPAETETSVSATPSVSVRGQAVEVCAVVTGGPALDTLPSSGTPTGTVTFTGPGSLNRTETLMGGEACFYSTTLETGTITATYDGTTGYLTSTDTTPVTVNPLGSTTAVTATPATSVRGTAVAVCATVTGSLPQLTQQNIPTPTGTVVFTGPGNLNRTVTLSGGQACFTSTTLSTGTITATYQGSTTYETSTNTASVTVSPPPVVPTPEPTPEPTPTPTPTPEPEPTTPPPPTKPVQINLNLTLPPNQSLVGANATMTGGGLAPSSRYILRMFSEPVVIASGVTNSLGGFRAAVKIPKKACVLGGLHQLVLTGTAPDGSTVRDSNWVVLNDSCSAKTGSGAKPKVNTVQLRSFIFPYQSARLTVTAKRAIRTQVSAMRGAKAVTITGYTQTGRQSKAARKANKLLAARRAVAVRKYLRALGVRVAIRTVGAGGVKPISTANQRLNRRVVITVRY